MKALSRAEEEAHEPQDADERRVGRLPSAEEDMTLTGSPKTMPARAIRTRDALLEAGRRLFASQAVEGVTIDEIVQAANVSKGSFYTHFKDRDALVQAVSRNVRAAVETAVTAANAEIDDPAQRIVRAVFVFLRFAVDDPERAGVLSRLNARGADPEASMNRGLVDDVAAGLSSGRIRVATVEAGVLYVLGVAQIALLRTVEDPRLAVAVTLAQQMGALLLRGFGLTAEEADTLAAQAADEIVRLGTFKPGGAPP